MLAAINANFAATNICGCNSRIVATTESDERKIEECVDAAGVCVGGGGGGEGGLGLIESYFSSFTDD